VSALAESEWFWAKPDVPLLVKAFTRLQYETAARVTELLSADIADLDMETAACGSPPRAATSSGSTSSRARRGRSQAAAGAVERPAVRHRHAARVCRAPTAADVCPTTGRVAITAETDPNRRRK
jgi:hypothetical protein